MLRPLLLIFILTSLTGCFAPKQIEFGQRKVRALPEYPAAAVERQKQAAHAVSERLRFHLNTNGLIEVREIAEALSSNLGAPEEAWCGSGTDLAAKLRKDENRLDREIGRYREKIAPDVGKKIEGTGWFQIGFFKYYALLALGLVLIWCGLKVYGWFNPAVALGTRLVSRAGRAVVQYGFGEVVEGGQRFKERLAQSQLDDQVKAAVIDLFTTSHREMQSRDTQDLVRQLKP